MGKQGCVYVSHDEAGMTRAKDVKVVDTTGAGDAFCSGLVSGLTYGKTLRESTEIGTVLAADVIRSIENVCPEVSFDDIDY